MKTKAMWVVLSMLVALVLAPMVGCSGFSTEPTGGSDLDGSARVRLEDTRHLVSFAWEGDSLFVTCEGNFAAKIKDSKIIRIDAVYKNGTVVSEPFTMASRDAMIIENTLPSGSVKWMVVSSLSVYSECRITTVRVSGKSGHWEGEYYSYY